MYRFSVTLITGITLFINLSAQQSNIPRIKENDSIVSEEIIFTPALASTYIIDLLNMQSLWKPGSDSIHFLLERLIEQYHETYDSIETRLSKTQFRSTGFQKVDTLQHDTLAVRWLNDSTFIIDTSKLQREPIFVQKTVIKKITDLNDSISSLIHTGAAKTRISESKVDEEDIVVEVLIDTAYLASEKIQLYQIKNRRIVPGIFSAGSNKSYHFLRDGSKLIISEPVQITIAGQNSPFNIVPNEKLPDSLDIAVQTLLNYTSRRDSIQIYLNNIDGVGKPFWLTFDDDELQRYWVKNKKDDSVSIWIGNPDKSNVTLILEDDIHVERVEKESFDDIPFTMAIPSVKLADVKPLKEIPIFWDFDFSTSFSLSQNYLSNWAQGGESSLSNLLDIKGQAKYTNKETKTEWTSNIRLKYGSVLTKEYDGLRKNTDILEFDSKYNRALRKKIDFSALYHMKSQIAEGYNYTEDSASLVSKFLNPATFTVGVGFEYKPINKTTVNFSVLSYKNTFVLDTVNIDQTNHGIDENKFSKQEMGGQILIENEHTFFEDMKISNSLRLFSNYLKKPENVDVEWEVELEKQISLYFTISLNIHMIYDDDILLPKLDEDGDPVLLTDGTEVKIPQLQFKQFLGLTFLVKL